MKSLTVFVVGLLAFIIFANGAAAQYSVRYLASDGIVPADHIDPNLLNPWGLVAPIFGPFVIANNHAGNATFQTGSGAPFSFIVPHAVNIAPFGDSAPTGVVLNNGGGFAVSEGSSHGPSWLIFVGEDGRVSGWNPFVDIANSIVAFSASDGAIYKGVALARNRIGAYLFATDFHNNKVDVFDRNFNKVGSFTDPTVDAGYAPFNIQLVHDRLIITFGKQDANAEDNESGPGLGFVDVFDTNGVMVKRLISHGALNAPWGVASAPSGFGKFSKALLIGNFGDGEINAFNPSTGDWLGALMSSGSPIHIEGLWGLHFGTGLFGGNPFYLYFTAGPNEEQDGIFGVIKPH